MKNPVSFVPHVPPASLSSLYIKEFYVFHFLSRRLQQFSNRRVLQKKDKKDKNYPIDKHPSSVIK
jgi:hypothetical protein